MRCSCCDKNLSDYEATLRVVSTNDFADTCLKCLQGLQIAVKGNSMLKKKIDQEEELLIDDESELMEDFYDMDDVCIDYSMLDEGEEE